jgi:hypothetical protein
VGGRNRPGLGLAAASYRHEVSRADEAHLHVHNVIVNAVAVPVLDADGRPVLDEHGVGRTVWRALDGEVLLRHVRTAGFVGAAVLRHELSARRGLTWGPVRNGVADVAGFPRELLEAFSTRRGQVLEEFAQLVDAGFAPDAATLAAAQRASRAPKRVLADEQVRAVQGRRLAAAGWTPEQVRALADPRPRRIDPPDAQDVAELYERLAGPAGLTERATTFGWREVVQAVAGWAADRLDAEAITTIAQRFLADPRVVLLSTAGRRRRSLPDPPTPPSTSSRPSAGCWPCAAPAAHPARQRPSTRSWSRRRSAPCPPTWTAACPASRRDSSADCSPTAAWSGWQSGRRAPARPRPCARSYTP